MKVRVKYFAILREQRGLEEESLTTSSTTPRELYDELRQLHGFKLGPDHVRPAVNGAFVANDHALHENDEVVFVPPVAGG